MSLSSKLMQAFREHPFGLCGQHEPAQALCRIKDFEMRVNTLSLGAILDINLLSPERWSGLLALSGHWLIDPSQVAYRSSKQVQAAMQELYIQGPGHISRVWWQVCRGVQGRFKGSWKALLTTNERNALMIQSYLRQHRTTFPILAGPVISARWLDLVHRIGGIDLYNWEKLIVPLAQRPKKTARLFGVTADAIHPLLLNALVVWPAACKKLSEESCGLAGCPGK